ncbi:hypothetical protein LCGC14_1322780 [marine sediment metagenome]|uniref:Uncharacterized protein n=1 Tax=marine sediment metagenome TaxID=412755 RepID=A0A0F9KJ15_9ZZZZ
MEQQDLLNKKVGTKEMAKLEAKEVEVQGLRVDDKSKEGKKYAPLLVLICKHPDKEQTIEITKIKLLQDEKTRVVGLWVQEDSEGNIQKGCSVHKLLETAKVGSPSELEGKKLPTIKQSDESAYLCIKGY